MEEFVNRLELNKFRSTNGKWNELMLNDPWSVGYVTTLIELREWISKEEWERFYYESGAKRKTAISQLAPDEKSMLENFQLVRTNKSEVLKVPFNLKNLNTQYGRTEEDFAEKGRVLYEAVKNNGYGLTVDECIECVRFRTICETWNGVVVREANTIQNLRTLFPKLEFRKTSGEIDFEYAVDYEVYKADFLIGAIQIKPKSYLWNAPHINLARNANERKQLSYFKLKNIRVINIISDKNGKIEHQDEVVKYLK